MKRSKDWSDVGPAKGCIHMANGMCKLQAKWHPRSHKKTLIRKCRRANCPIDVRRNNAALWPEAPLKCPKCRSKRITKLNYDAGVQCNSCGNVMLKKQEEKKEKKKTTRTLLNTDFSPSSATTNIYYQF